MQKLSVQVEKQPRYSSPSEVILESEIPTQAYSIKFEFILLRNAEKKSFFTTKLDYWILKVDC